MSVKVGIRDERESDVEAITEITRSAFKDCPYSQHTEEFIVIALRKAKALTISLVAEREGEVVGHMALSPARIADEVKGWYGLGPISVAPRAQRQGIGSALMREGLSRLKRLGAKGCVLVGDPKYYSRFGFKSFPELTVEGVPQQYVQALCFGEDRAKGKVEFHEAFRVKE